VGDRRLEIGITRPAPILLVGSVTGDEPSPLGHSRGRLLAGPRAIPRSMPKPHADVIEKQQVCRLLCPNKPRELPRPVLLLAFLEGVWLCRQLMPADGSEQVFLAKVDISIESA
jgi:hypothetical protein